jgi:hypothetical protein
MLSKSSRNLNNENKWEFGSTNTQQNKYGKGGNNSYNKGKIKKIQPQENQCKPQEKKGNMKMMKGSGKWYEFHKIPWNNTDECHLKQLFLVELK